MSLLRHPSVPVDYGLSAAYAIWNGISVIRNHLPTYLDTARPSPHPGTALASGVGFAASCYGIGVLFPASLVF